MKFDKSLEFIKNKIKYNIQVYTDNYSTGLEIDIITEPIYDDNDLLINWKGYTSLNFITKGYRYLIPSISIDIKESYYMTFDWLIFSFMTYTKD